jgi:hypothetical protein
MHAGMQECHAAGTKFSTAENLKVEKRSDTERQLVETKFSKISTRQTAERAPEGFMTRNLGDPPVKTKIGGSHQSTGDPAVNLRKSHTNYMCDDFGVNEISLALGNKQRETGRYRNLVREQNKPPLDNFYACMVARYE